VAAGSAVAGSAAAGSAVAMEAAARAAADSEATGLVGLADLVGLAAREDSETVVDLVVEFPVGLGAAAQEAAAGCSSTPPLGEDLVAEGML